MAAVFKSGESETVSIVIGNLEYSGWAEVQINRSVETACSSFTLSVSEKYPSTGEQIAIQPLDACIVKIGGEPVITGFVDKVNLEYSSNSNKRTITGRSKTCDIVDCSHLHTTGAMNNQTLLQMAVELCQPYGVKVIDKTNNGTGLLFPMFQLEMGETVFDALERAARLRAVLLTDDENGNLIITQAGNRRAGILQCKAGAEDSNILSGVIDCNVANRFSEYRIRGQGIGNDDLFGIGANTQQAIAKDPTISRTRVYIKILESGGTVADCQVRANWECSTRGGKGLILNYKVAGWRGSDKLLWASNSIVSVYDDFGNINTDLVISAVSYTIDNHSGTIAELTLMPPSALAPDPSYKDPRQAAYANLYVGTAPTAPDSFDSGTGNGWDNSPPSGVASVMSGG